MWTDRWTGRHDKANSCFFAMFVQVPKNCFLAQTMYLTENTVNYKCNDWDMTSVVTVV
jgi:hypothetical protein